VSRRALITLVALTTSGCFLDRTGTRPGDLDASSRPDASADLDASRADAGPRDAGEAADSGRADAGDGVDGGEDAGPGDAGLVDAGPGSTVPVTAGLIVHFDARNVTGLGGPPAPEMPSTWVDLTGGNDARCEQVTYDPDGLRPGDASMFTDGNDGSRCRFDIPDLDDLTIFLVFRNSDTRDDGGNWFQNPVLVGGDASGAREDAALYWADGRPGFARAGTGYQFRYSTSYADDVPHVLAFVREGESGIVAARVDRDSPELGMADPGPISDPDWWWLAAHDSSASNGRLANHYAELLIYDDNLTGPDIDAVREYLFARWGI